MGVFRFSLEQVLRYRKQLEEQATLVFSRAVHARDKRLAEKLRCEAAILDAQKKLADVAALDADERWLVSGYSTALRYDLEQMRSDLVALEEDVDRSRIDLTRKAQDRKLLEKLREKQASRHKLAESHREQQNYDDITTIRFVPPAV